MPDICSSYLADAASGAPRHVASTTPSSSPSRRPAHARSRPTLRAKCLPGRGPPAPTRGRLARAWFPVRRPVRWKWLRSRRPRSGVWWSARCRRSSGQGCPGHGQPRQRRRPSRPPEEGRGGEGRVRRWSELGRCAGSIRAAWDAGAAVTFADPAGPPGGRGRFFSSLSTGFLAAVAPECAPKRSYMASTVVHD